MKKNLFSTKLLLIISFALLVFSCKDDDEVTGTQRYKEPPVLLSSIPATGGTVSFADNSIRLIFDREVTVVDLGMVSVNNAIISGSYISGDTLIFTLDGIDEKTQYTLTIAKGAIKGVPGLLNQEDITVSFNTGEALALTKTLVTPNASAQAKNVFNFLLENYRNKIISGSMARVNWNTDEADRVYRWTGKYPAINTFDFVHLYASPASWIDYSNTTVAENWWNNKGLISIMWHWNVPIEGTSNFGFYYTGKNNGEGETSFDITKAVQDGTDENKIIKADLDKVATHLLALQAKGIPVIWRPLHEAAGGWFWWGAKDANSYKALWILMFDTFKAKGINNLIWVWTTETNDNSWYPGDAYVDIIGRDIYNKKDAAAIYKEYLSIRKTYPGKMVTLSECGNVANISQQWSANAKWSWYMPWYDYNATDESEHSHATKAFWTDAFASDKVITRDQMPSLK